MNWTKIGDFWQKTSANTANYNIIEIEKNKKIKNCQAHFNFKKIMDVCFNFE